MIRGAFGALLSLTLAIPSVAGDWMWAEPAEIASRDLFYGPGGKDHQPHTTYTFIKENFHGSNPKFDVRDENGVKWRVKLGVEARPEVVASRLLWAVGYFTTEDYFVHDFRAEGMPRLKRGRKLIGPDGDFHDVSLKRRLSDEKKIGSWRWRENPFTGARELNGLRVMMALINNWDLKDVNNSIYEEQNGASGLERRYMVSDLGASFGGTGLGVFNRRGKGNIRTYRRSKFIRKVTPQYVDFNVPTRPTVFLLIKPRDFFMHFRERWIGKHIPRSDTRWIVGLLSKLSKDQIRQAFRAAGYSPEEVEELSTVLEERIGELNTL